MSGSTRFPVMESVRRLLNTQGVRIDVVHNIMSELSLMRESEVCLFFHLCSGRTQEKAAMLAVIPKSTASWIVSRKFKNIRDLLDISIA